MASQDLMDQGELKRKEMLKFCRAFIKKNGYGPSLDEIQVALGYASKSTVKYHIDVLRDRGKISWKPGVYRSLRVL